MKKERLKLIITFATILVLVAAAGLTVLLLQRQSPKLKARLDEVWSDFQGCTVTVGDTELFMTGGSFAVTDDRGRGEEMEVDGEGNQSFEWYDLTLPIVPSRTPDVCEVSVNEGATEIFRGDLEGYNRLALEDGHTYYLNLRLDYSGADYTATIHFMAEVTLSAPPAFTLSSESVAQGDTLLIYGKNIRAQDVAVEVPYSYVPVAVYRGTDCMILLPFNYIRSPGEYEATVTYGGETYTLPYTVTETDFPVQYLEVSDAVASSTYESNDAVEEYNTTIPPLLETFDPNVYWKGVFQYPFEGDIKPNITTEYGIKRYVNNSTTPSRHTGIDIAKGTGTPVMATAAGKILFSGYLQMSGNTVIVDHGCGVMSLNLHMDSLNVETGDFVEQGDVIGAVGETGFATGPHLHYALFVGGHAVNPWLAFDGTAGFYQIVTGD